VVTVFFAVIMGSMAIGQGAPNLSYFANAKGAAWHVFNVIDRESEIDPISDDGVKVIFLSYLDNKTKLNSLRENPNLIYFYPSFVESLLFLSFEPKAPFSYRKDFSKKCAIQLPKSQKPRNLERSQPRYQGRANCGLCGIIWLWQEYLNLSDSKVL